MIFSKHYRSVICVKWALFGSLLIIDLRIIIPLHRKKELPFSVLPPYQRVIIALVYSIQVSLLCWNGTAYVSKLWCISIDVIRKPNKVDCLHESA